MRWLRRPARGQPQAGTAEPGRRQALSSIQGDGCRRMVARGARSAALVLWLAAGLGFGFPPPQASSGASARWLGTVKATAGDTLALATDSGPQISVRAGDSTRILRIEPGQKDLKSATPIRLADVEVGDRVLVLGKAAEDGQSVAAASLIVMKQTSIEQERAREQEEWEKNGVGGLVSAIDAAGRTVTISTMSGGALKKVTVRVAKDTILRRYAPNSVRYADAKPGTFDQIRPGDQLLARGTRNADGSELAAAEIVSGSFQNIAGTIASVDPGTGEIRVMDLLTKKPVVVRVTADSELRSLPPRLAQGLALRLKGGPGKAGGWRAAAGRAVEASPAERAWTESGHGRGAAPPDLQQILNRLPVVHLADLQKGEAIMIVATEAGTSQVATAIKLLSGVEPLLASSPKGGESTLLSAWSLSAPAGGEGEVQ